MKKGESGLGMAMVDNKLVICDKNKSDFGVREIMYLYISILSLYFRTLTLTMRV